MNKNKTIAIISPSKKYPGGIYHFTIKTALELKKFCNVKVISFKKQYPKFLYPGNQNNENLVDLNFEDECAILKWYDYFSWKNAMKIVKNHANLIYIPYWTIILAIPLLFLAKMSKKHGIKVIIEFHNLFDHDSGKIKKIFSSLIINRLVQYSDLCIAHTKENSEKLKELVKHEANTIILPLGPLNDLKHLENPKEIYDLYSIDKKKKYILMFGIVRKYKGLEYAIKAMNLLNRAEFSDYKLLVVGEIWKDLSGEMKLIEQYNLKKKIKFINEFVPDEHIRSFFEISDIIIYPYIDATQSGSLQFAFKSKKPVIATKVGCFREVIKNRENGILVPPMDSKKLSEAIIEVINDKVLADTVSKGGYNYYKEKLSWVKIIDQINSEIEKL